MHQKPSVWRPDFARTRWGNLQRSPDLLAGLKIGGRDKGKSKGKTGGDRQLREKDKGRKGGAGGGKGRKRVGGEWMQADISQGRPKALPAMQNASQKSSGNKNKELGGQSLNLVSLFSGK